MKVELKKDGFIYVDEKKMSLFEVEKMIGEQLPAGCVLRWMDEYDDEDGRAVVVCGSWEGKGYDMMGLKSGWKSVSDWWLEVNRIIGEVKAWYDGLPVDSGEFYFEEK